MYRMVSFRITGGMRMLRTFSLAIASLLITPMMNDDIL